MIASAVSVCANVIERELRPPLDGRIAICASASVAEIYRQAFILTNPIHALPISAMASGGMFGFLHAIIYGDSVYCRIFFSIIFRPIFRPFYEGKPRVPQEVPTAPTEKKNARQI